jgi:hypothetical protein
MMTFSYDEESRGPLGTTGALLLVERRRRF